MKKLIVASGYPIRNRTFSTYKSLREVITTSRLEYKPDQFRFHLLSEKIAELPNQKAPAFDECCALRTLEIDKMDQPVFILWSGGIDSTAALVAILKYGPLSLKKRTTVLLNRQSLREYPGFFPTICKEFQINTSSAELQTYAREGIVLTGELGDQLFGSDVIFDVVAHFGEQALFQDYEKSLLPLFVDRAGDKQGAEVFRRYEGICREAPFPIKTCYDFLWWWNFSQKWQHVKFRFLMNGAWDEPQFAVRRVKAFYDSVSFQLWSLQNHDKKIESNLLSYKKVAKDFIIETTRDTDYFKKLKVGSLGYIWYGHEAHFAADANYDLVPHEQADNYLEANS